MMEDKQSKKDFSGFYSPEASCRSDSDYDSSFTKGQKKDISKGKKNDKGYAALDSQSSGEELDQKNSSKSRRTKSFKFLQKKDKEEIKKKKEDRDDKKKEKKREKEERRLREKEERRKEKTERKKRKKLDPDEMKDDACTLFGVPLSLAIERNPCFDGIRLPAIVRLCIDFIEEKGLTCEGIYRTLGSKVKVQALRKAFNCGEIVSFQEQHPHNVASLLKQYLKELPETVLTVDMMPHFEDVSLIPNPRERAEAMRQLIEHLPTPNRLLLQYMLKHMAHVIESEEAKMSYHNVCVILSPVMQISHRVLNVMFHSHHYLVRNVEIKKYVPPITSINSEGALDHLQTKEDIEGEIGKQESLLSHIHSVISSGQTSQTKEEMMWEAQRIVTLLKRMLKNIHRKDQMKTSGVLSRNDGTESDAQSENSSKNSAIYNATNEAKIQDKMSTSIESTGKSISSDQELAETPSNETNSALCEPCSSSLKSSESENDRDKSAPDNNSVQVSAQDVIPISKSSENSLPSSQKVFPIAKISLSSQSPLKSASRKVNNTSSSASKDGLRKISNDQVIPVLPKPLLSKTERAKTAGMEGNIPPESFKNIESDYSSSLVSAEQSESKLQNSSYRKQLIPSIDSAKLPFNPPSNSKKKQDVVENPEQYSEITQSDRNCSDNSSTIRNVKFDTTHFHSVNAISQGKIPEISLDESSSWEVLTKEDKRLKFEHEELLNLNQELTRKLQFEKSEISRLKDEIQEIQTLYGYRINSYDSSDTESEDSEDNSDDECDIFSNILHLQKYNAQLEANNSFIVKKIQSEREAIIRLNVALKSQYQAQIKTFSPPLPLC